MQSMGERIIVATDAGREGELIFRYIYSYLECRTPFVPYLGYIPHIVDEADPVFAIVLIHIITKIMSVSYTHLNKQNGDDNKQQTD